MLSHLKNTIEKYIFFLYSIIIVSRSVGRVLNSEACYTNEVKLHWDCKFSNNLQVLHFLQLTASHSVVTSRSIKQHCTITIPTTTPASNIALDQNRRLNLNSMPGEKMTGETPEVRSDKRKQQWQQWQQWQHHLHSNFKKFKSFKKNQIFLKLQRFQKVFWNPRCYQHLWCLY